LPENPAKLAEVHPEKTKLRRSRQIYFSTTAAMQPDFTALPTLHKIGQKENRPLQIIAADIRRRDAVVRNHPRALQ
jgi:hypothetical protein